ncbi:response regulator [bacterium]|nr:response regulator [bacterium]
MSGKRVLVIDEHVETRRKLREELLKADWIVDDVSDALSGLESIHQARTYGEGYHLIISAIFLPDLDGLLFIRTLREQYPEIPFIVLTGYGDEDLKTHVQSQPLTVYLEKPLDMDRLYAEIGKFDLDKDTSRPLPAPPLTPPDDAVGAYVYFNIDTASGGAAAYDALRALSGVRSANAVRGEFNLVLRVAVPSQDALDKLIADAKKVPGATYVSYELYVPAMLGASNEEFVRHYQTVAAEVNKDYLPGQDTNAYLMIDVDRYQMERIYTSILLTEGVYRCRVISSGTKLMVLMSHAVRPGVVRHLLRKLAEMDGILRVREATVINVAE